MTINVTDSDGDSATITSTATIADAALTGSGVSFSATAGQSFTGVVATFTDADPAGTVGDYTATITWGDGTANSSGTISGGFGSGFAVQGSHSYASTGNYTLTIAIHDHGANASPTSTAVVSTVVDPPPTGTPGLPPVTPPDDCGCVTDAVGTAPGVSGNGAEQGFTDEPVRYFDGAAKLSTTDVSSGGFGMDWGQTRFWSNSPGYSATAFNGTGNVVAQWPYLRQNAAGNEIIVISNGVNARYFDQNGSTYTPRLYLKEALSHDTVNNQFVLTDTTGNVIRFADFSTSYPANQRGQFQSLTDPDGNVTSVTSRITSGQPGEVQRSTTVGMTTTTESFLYTYVASGVNQGQLANVTLRRRVNGGAWSIVRQTDYAYYDGTQAHGNAGDLMTATIKDGSGNVLDTDYYRYYTGEAGGYVHGLKYVFGSDSYSRLLAAYPSPTTATDTQVAPYADNYFEYDALQRVTKEIAQGAGTSLGSGATGQGTFTYVYFLPSTNTTGYNSWKYKTLEVLPDGNQNLVYANGYGEVMLKVFRDQGSGLQWENFYKYDSAGRLILTAAPSALTGYNDAKADLLNSVGGNYQYMSDTSGLVSITDYASATTATDVTAGNVAGYVQDTKIQQGELGTPILQDSAQYISHTGVGSVVYPIASHTVYGNTDGTGGETTSYSYTWFSGTMQMQSQAVSRPVISTAQNGPGSADVQTSYFDAYGRPIWTKDGDGFLNYTAYDAATGAVTKTITDVDTTKVTDFQNLPPGWVTPSGGGLHLITQMSVDALGRTTAETDPGGNVTYTVYLDSNHEVRTYPGWNSSTNTPTGPTVDDRYDEAGSYHETLTMSATPAVDGSGHPTGSEAIGSLQTLSRTYTSAGGQDVRRDDYFTLSGLTYSTALYIGVSGTNYYSSLTDYDVRGRPTRTVSPTSTITRTVYDSLGRVSSVWVGTNDTPASGSWSPSNNTAPANMVKVSDTVYDGGGVADGNATQTTDYPGGSAAARVTQNFFDWRDRLVASKQGVQASEADGTHRPITYNEYDNLNEVTAVDRYDGDGVSITVTAGVPNKPSASLLRSYTTSNFDDQGRGYQSHVFSVDQSTGAISSTSLTTNTWFDHRGEVIKTSEPGGLVTKEQYDGAQRLAKSYTSDGGGDTAWADAGNVTGDNVLSQTENQYDAAGNVILVTTRERFHDETATGALGDPNTSPKARVSYVADYYDPANRLTAEVSVGTNAGTAYTRPSSVPAASDTVLVTAYGYNAAGWVQTVTDPRGLVENASYDNLGRVTKDVQDYTNGTPTSSSDQTTDYTYDGSGHVLTVKAEEPAGAYQTTQYVYGVTTGSGNDVNSNDILAATQYPDPTTGNPSSTLQETYTVNALGERKTFTDRDGNVHTYTLDILGRQKADAVTTLGTGVDGSVRRIETAYDTGGRPYLYTSYNAASGGTIVNQVQQAYNGLGQLTTEYQSHSGAVNTSTTPNVQYAYSQMAGGANHSRLTSMTYPNGRVLNYNYTSGLDDSISRLTSISDTSATLESYNYLGLDTVVRRAHPQPGVDLTYIKQTGESTGDAGDQYTGLDRFGRVVNQRWIVTANGTHTDRFAYGYDRDSNRLYRDNQVNSSFGELYHANGAANGYDGLNRLTAVARGALTDTNADGVPDTVQTPSHSQNWSLDALGNWSSVTTDGSSQTRSHNQQNEITSISGLTTPGYDANGNTTTDQVGHTLVYDAWNRLVQLKSGSTVLEAYGFDALGRRITENPGTQRDLYLSSGWQVLEERVGSNVQDQEVWSPVYVDALIERDRDPTGGGTLSERLYVQQDANWNVTALVDASGNVQERYAYDPYGLATILAPNWTTRTSSSFAWAYLHQGGRYDTATGLYIFRNRDYSPLLGRWLQVDPLGFGGGDSNLYSYVRADPSTASDPSGLDTVALIAVGRLPYNPGYDPKTGRAYQKATLDPGDYPTEPITKWSEANPLRFDPDAGQGPLKGMLKGYIPPPGRIDLPKLNCPELRKWINATEHSILNDRARFLS